MIDLKGFRIANKLTQEELGAFLGIKKSFISKIEHGGAKLPDDKFSKLLDNTRGWDTSTLIDEGTAGKTRPSLEEETAVRIPIDVGEILALRKENEMLRAQVEELKVQNEKYWKMIEKLTEK